MPKTGNLRPDGERLTGQRLMGLGQVAVDEVGVSYGARRR